MLIETKMDNVVQLNKESVYKDIELYFKELAVHAPSTRQAYEKDIKDYFNIHKGIEDINFLTIDDIKVDRQDLIGYRQKLIKLKNYSNATINRKIKALKSLIDSLASYGYEVNTNAFKKWKWLNETTVSYGELTFEEAEQMAELALTTEKEKAEIKYYLIKIATRTSYRISDLLKLEWKNFDKHGEYYLVKVYEKKTGKYAKKPITKELYMEMEEKLRVRGQSVVFNISKQGVQRMMDRLRDKMGINPDRNITFHSLRNVGINICLETGDITVAAKQGNHSDINTTYKHYINKTENYDLMAGAIMDKELNVNVLNGLSKEEIIDLITNSSKKVQYELITQAEKFNDNKIN